MNKAELLTRSKFRRHKSKMILSLNFGKLDINDAYKVIDYSSRIIERMPKNSIYTLTNVTDSNFDQKLINALTKFTQKNKPHVVAGAVIGAEGLKKFMFNTILRLSGRNNMKIFDREDEALEWLIKQSRA